MLFVSLSHVVFTNNINFKASVFRFDWQVGRTEIFRKEVGDDGSEGAGDDICTF